MRGLKESLHEKVKLSNMSKDIKKSINVELIGKGTKFCYGCNKELPLTAFGKDKHRKDGLTTKCRECRNKRNLDYMHNHPDLQKRHNEQNKENRKKYYGDPVRKRKYRNFALQKAFGLTVDDYDIMLKRQDGVCAICKRHRIAARTYHMVIDHNHKTGVTRGILCNWCNRALGLLGDNIQFLENAIVYLKGNKNE